MSQGFEQIQCCVHTFIPFRVAKEHIFLLQNLLATCVLLYVRLFACLSVQIRTVP